MEKKNLGEEYATERLQDRQIGNEITFGAHEVFTETDIADAFNAGRESVIEHIPDLEWEDISCGAESCFIATSIGLSYKITFASYEFEVFCNNNYITRSISLYAAKRDAYENYKYNIKQALGL